MPDSQPIQHASLPSWLISVVLHVALILVLGWTVRFAVPKGAAAERTAEVGIVLKRQDGDRQYFQGQSDAGDSSANALAASTAGSLQDLLDEPQPSDPSGALPRSLAVIGPGGLDGGGVPSATGAASGNGSAGTGRGHALGGEATTGVFGIQGTGYKFAYVFDRSGSMGGPDRSPLEAAKAQLLASLRSLGKTHQFQIIFYNDQPQRFSPTGQPNRLFFATEQNKALAAKFIGSIVAEGGTRHMDALLMAIKLQPDVIFFLTDADEPKLGPKELAEIKRRATGITINAIQFGYGPQTDPDNFLVRLARDSGGRHGYVDISGLAPRRK
jgi:hypothetical protein